MLVYVFDCGCIVAGLELGRNGILAVHVLLH